MAYSLVPDDISHDMKEAAKQIRDLVEAGEMSGLVFGATLRGRRFIVNVAGTLARDPLLARGVAACIDDEVQQMIHGRKDSNTTI